MPSTYTKSISLALLSVLLFMFSGLSALASSPALDAPDKSRRDACSKEKSRITNTCSTPDCPLYLCITATIASPASILAPEALRVFSSSIEVRSPRPAAKAVFHPRRSVAYPFFSIGCSASTYLIIDIVKSFMKTYETTEDPEKCMGKDEQESRALFNKIL